VALVSPLVGNTTSRQAGPKITQKAHEKLMFSEDPHHRCFMIS
jgi:hypothetical protein